MLEQNLHHRNGHLVTTYSRRESDTMDEQHDSSSTMRNTITSTPQPAEKDGLMREGDDIAADHHDHPPDRSMHLHHSSDSDFWSTVAGIAGNVLEWYDFAGNVLCCSPFVLFCFRGDLSVSSYTRFLLFPCL